jgi:hypothetical protein
MLSYVATYLAAISFREHEYIVAGIHFAILIDLLSHFSQSKSVFIVVFGALMACAEIVCVRYFDMWKYNNTKFDVPVWLPTAWSIVGAMIIDLSRRRM